jgi:hypothetical protein
MATPGLTASGILYTTARSYRPTAAGVSYPAATWQGDRFMQKNEVSSTTFAFTREEYVRGASMSLVIQGDLRQGVLMNRRHNLEGERTMTLPGFSAEQSLYANAASYSSRPAHGPWGSRTVSPALRRDPTAERACKNNCQYGPSYGVCINFCECLWRTDNSVWTCIAQAYEDLENAPAA